MRVVALTGAGRGLGLLTTRVLLDQGVTVVANHRSASPELSALSDKYPDTLHLVPGDVGEEAAGEAIARCAREIGRLDAVVLNAGITRDRPLVSTSVEDWDEVHRVNLRGAFLTTKHALRLMMRQRYGRFVYLSSIAALSGNAGQAAYATSKAGLHGLSQAVAQEYGRYGVRSVVLVPGLLDTGLGAALAPELQQRKIDRSLLGLGSAEQVAATVAFLAGPDADYINATVIRQDGGLVY
ncbi:hypothetical protein GCM10022243_00450 [Saccharothrix violaceirubra]|uniref:3-oxoacyl-[acyl-carrier protein] reductase n=1 Tax=Saccharothrix violaceirubra TaxID=413306 RepID=A0A7W7WVU9_9PSEU|nr:SDR family oxidoreductase [Saccharothrix violaceirubra]MBB4965461.1 3-oxoacyl-[acyl-carrier protein] reductase [Saccharothrix violaceirubra]